MRPDEANRSCFTRRGFRGNKPVYTRTYPVFRPADLALLFAKLANTELTPSAFRVPAGVLKGRRPISGEAAVLLPKVAEMRKAVEDYARENFDTSKTGPISCLKEGGTIRLRNADASLGISYDIESGLVYFDRMSFHTELLLAAVPHVLRDTLIASVDPRYFFPFLPLTMLNMWRGEPPVKPEWWKELIPLIASSGEEQAEREDDAELDLDLNLSEDLEEAEIAGDPAELLGLLEATTQRLQVDSENAAVTALLKVAAMFIPNLAQTMREAGIIARPLQIDSVERIPEALKKPFSDYVQELLEEGIRQTEEARTALESQRAENAAATDSLVAELAERDAALTARSRELEAEAARLSGLADTLEKREERLARAREAFKQELLADAVNFLAQASGERLTRGEKRRHEDAKFVVGHLTRRDLPNAR